MPVQIRVASEGRRTDPLPSLAERRRWQRAAVQCNRRRRPVAVAVPVADWHRRPRVPSVSSSSSTRCTPPSGRRRPSSTVSPSRRIILRTHSRDQCQRRDPPRIHLAVRSARRIRSSAPRRRALVRARTGMYRRIVKTPASAAAAMAATTITEMPTAAIARATRRASLPAAATAAAISSWPRAKWSIRRAFTLARSPCSALRRRIPVRMRMPM
jgi:hypothetical protein